MTVLWPWMLLLWPLPWLLGFFVRARSAPPTPTLHLPVADLLPLPGATAETSSTTRTFLLRRPRLAPMLVWTLLLLAAARPIAWDDAQTRSVTGRELMLALDISASMGTRDLQLDGVAVTRLQAARALARDFLARRDGDRIGLIVFGRQAYLHTPLTFDLAAITHSLGDIEIGLAGQETALGDAIALAVSRLAEFAGSTRTLVLLTDGANTAGELSPPQAGWLAQRAAVRLHIVGIGSSDGAAPGSLDDAALEELARQTGGSYRRASDSAALAAFYRTVDALEPVEHADAPVSVAQELYPWPLATALVLWLAVLFWRAGTPHARGRP